MVPHRARVGSPPPVEVRTVKEQRAETCANNGEDKRAAKNLFGGDIGGI